MKNRQSSLTLFLNITSLVLANQNPTIMIARKEIEDIKKWRAEIVGKELYVSLLADGMDFLYLIMFMQLIFRQSGINE